MNSLIPNHHIKRISKQFLRQPRRDYINDATASQINFDAESLCKVSEYEGSTNRKHNLPKKKSINSMRRAIYWLFQNGFVDISQTEELLNKHNLKSSSKSKKKKNFSSSTTIGDTATKKSEEPEMIIFKNRSVLCLGIPSSLRRDSRAKILAFRMGKPLENIIRSMRAKKKFEMQKRMMYKYSECSEIPRITEEMNDDTQQEQDEEGTDRDREKNGEKNINVYGFEEDKETIFQSTSQEEENLSEKLYNEEVKEIKKRTIAVMTDKCGLVQHIANEICANTEEKKIPNANRDSSSKEMRELEITFDGNKTSHRPRNPSLSPTSSRDSFLTCRRTEEMETSNPNAYLRETKRIEINLENTKRVHFSLSPTSSRDSFFTCHTKFSMKLDRVFDPSHLRRKRKRRCVARNSSIGHKNSAVGYNSENCKNNSKKDLTDTRRRIVSSKYSSYVLRKICGIDNHQESNKNKALTNNALASLETKQRVSCFAKSTIELCATRSIGSNTSNQLFLEESSNANDSVLCETCHKNDAENFEDNCDSLREEESELSDEIHKYFKDLKFYNNGGDLDYLDDQRASSIEEFDASESAISEFLRSKRNEIVERVGTVLDSLRGSPGEIREMYTLKWVLNDLYGENNKFV